MKREEIERRLTDWFSLMTAKYIWLSFKYEFSKKLGVFIVGFYPSEKVDNNDDFCAEAIAFEDYMASKYGEDSPLFGNEDDCFLFSDAARIYSQNTFVKRFDYISSPCFTFNNLSTIFVEQEEYSRLAA